MINCRLRTLTTSLTGLLCILLASSYNLAQEVESLPDDFNELIQLKTQRLETYSELQKSGQADKALQVLRTIIDIHRKALKLGIANREPENIIGQLQKLFADDAEYLSDQLFAKGEYADSAKLRRELEQFYQNLLGPQHRATVIMHWQAITAEKLSSTSKEKQVAYVVAIGAESQAKQALQDGQLDVAATLYSQLIDAQIAVLGELHPKISGDLNEYGRTLYLQKKYSDAEAAYRRSLKTREATTGKDLQYATTLFNLGRLFQDTGKPADAEQQYLQAATIEEPILGSANPSFLQTLNQIALLYQQAGDAQKLAAIQQRIAAADPLNAVISHLPRGTFAAAAVQPGQLTATPGMQLLPFELIEAAGLQDLGFNPLNLEAAVAILTLPLAEPPFNFGFLFKLKQDVLAEYPWVKEMVPVQTDSGQQYLRQSTEGPGAMCHVQFDDGVVLVGSEETIRQSLTNSGATKVGELLKADRSRGQLIANVNMETIRAIVQLAVAEAPPGPPELEALKSLAEYVNTAQLWMGISNGLQLSLVLNSSDEPSAKRISEIVANSLNFGRQLAAQEIDSAMAGDDPMEAAARAYAQRMLGHHMDKLQPSTSGNSVTIQIDTTGEMVGPIAAALLLPAIQGARSAARRTQDMNNLKQIALAMHNYHDTFGKFPAQCSYSADMKPLLSWRVHLLPYLEQNALYEKFRLNEPWDSEHNIKLVAQMPSVYQSKAFNDATKTVYLAPYGKGCFLDGQEGQKMRDFTDGLSNTVMVVEADPERAVIWTKPEDLRFDERNPRNGLGNLRPQGFQAALADGSVHQISGDVDDETVRRLVIRNDGMPVDGF